MEEASQVLLSDQAEKGVLEKNGKMINTQINDMQVRTEEMQRALHEADGSKRKLMVESCDLTHHLEEAERTLHQLSKDKTSLTTQLDDAKRLADAETRVIINISANQPFFNTESGKLTNKYLYYIYTNSL